MEVNNANKEKEMQDFNQQGCYFHDQNDFERALECHRKVLNIAQELNNQEYELFALGNIAHTYKSMNELMEAERYFRLILTMSRDIGDETAEIQTLRHLIEVYEELENVNSLIESYQELINWVERPHSLESKCWSDAEAMQGLFGRTILAHPDNEVDVWRALITDRLRSYVARLFISSKYDEAAVCGHFLTVLQPDSKEILLELASAFDEVEHYEEAIFYCEKALKLDSKNLKARKTKALALFKGQRYIEAISCWKQLLDLAPEDAHAWVAMGACWMELDNWDEMLRCDDKATILQPRYLQAWVGKGIALQELQRYGEAANCYERVCELDAEFCASFDADIIGLRKLERASHGFRGKIHKLLKTYILRPIASSMAILYITIAEREIDLGNYKGAVKHLEIVVKLCEEYDKNELLMRALGELGVCYLNMEQLLESAEFSQRAYKLGIESGHLRGQELAIGYAGLAYLGMGRFPEAEEALRNALELAAQQEDGGSRIRWLKGLARLQFTQDRYDSGLKMLENTIDEIEMDNADLSTLNIWLDLAAYNKIEENEIKMIEIVHEVLPHLEKSGDSFYKLLAFERLGDLCIPDNVVHVGVDYDLVTNAIAYYHEALEIAKRLKIPEYEVELSTKLSHHLDDIEQKIHFAEQGLNVARQLDDVQLLGLALYELGRAYTLAIKPIESERCFKELLALNPPIHIKAQVLVYLGGIYLALGSLDDAQTTVKNTIELVQQMEFPSSSLIWIKKSCFGLLSSIHECLGELAQALHYQDLQLQIKTPQSDEIEYSFRAAMYFGEHIERRILPEARALTEQGNHQSAYSFYCEALEFLENARRHMPLRAHQNTFLKEKRSVYWEAIISAIESMHYEEAFEMLELAKTRTLIDQFASRDPVAGKVPREILMDYISAQENEQTFYQIYRQQINFGIDSNGEITEDIELPQKQTWNQSQAKVLATLERVRCHVAANRLHQI